MKPGDPVGEKRPVEAESSHQLLYGKTLDEKAEEHRSHHQGDKGLGVGEILEAELPVPAVAIADDLFGYRTPLKHIASLFGDKLETSTQFGLAVYTASHWSFAIDEIRLACLCCIGQQNLGAGPVVRDYRTHRIALFGVVNGGLQ